MIREKISAVLLEHWSPLWWESQEGAVGPFVESACITVYLFYIYLLIEQSMFSVFYTLYLPFSVNISGSSIPKLVSGSLTSVRASRFTHLLDLTSKNIISIVILMLQVNWNCHSSSILLSTSCYLVSYDKVLWEKNYKSKNFWKSKIKPLKEGKVCLYIHSGSLKHLYVTGTK